MREILFKAKRRKDYGNPKEWVYGVPCLDIDGDWSIVTHNMSRVVQDETICEYTGLTDKNGNKIFEGDIFLNKFHNEPTKIGIIRYGEYCNAFNSDPYCLHIGFYVDWNDDLQIMRKDLGFWCKRREVVGNIFDNPELLKGEVK